MHSGPSQPGSSDDPARPGPSGDDRTARARIRDAAIARFAADGVDGTSIRTIAEEAGVSPPLVIHHFGSKDELRIACDEYVVALVRDQKTAAMASGPGLDPVAALRTYRDGPPVLRYLARTLVDGSPHVAALVDDMVADATEYMALGVDNGMLKPTDHPEGRAAVLTLWSLGALVLHEHAQRLLGVDLTGDPQDAMPYFLPGAEMLARGVLTEEVYERMLAAFASQQEGGS